jgi:hypothetical protein
MQESKLEIEFINDDKLNPEGYLWRYIDFHKFFAFIRNQRLFLTRLDKFEDKREGIHLSHLQIEMLKRGMDKDPIFDQFQGIMTIDNLPSLTNQTEDELKEIQRFNFANCWFYDERGAESVAMWNLYSKPNSVALRIRYNDFKEKLLSSGVKSERKIKKLTLSPIEYIDFQNFQEVSKVSSDLHSSVFIKDLSFSHENEFRIVAEQEKFEIKKREYKEGISRQHQDKLYDSIYEYPGFNLILNDFSSYEFEIVFHPKSEEWAIKDLKELIKKYDIPFKTNESNLKLR